MFSHVTVGTNKMDKAEKFYNALLNLLGLEQRKVVPNGGPVSCCWINEGYEIPRFYVYSPFNEKAAEAGNGAMTAFLAKSKKAVETAYNAGVKMGGECEGKPCERDQYGELY